MKTTPQARKSVPYRIIPPLFGKRLQDLSEGGPAVGGGGREVGPAVHRLQPGGQEHAQGPPTAPSRSLQNIGGVFFIAITTSASDPDAEAGFLIIVDPNPDPDPGF